MATKPDDGFEFEIEGEALEGAKQTHTGAKDDVDIFDDTPEEDRGRQPMPKKIVEELEQDELEDYSEKVKQRLKAMKKVWHDERREKERVQRENAEALAAAQRLLEENKRLKATMGEGETLLISSWKQSAELEAAAARHELAQAHDSGDTDKIVAAQQKLAEAAVKLDRVQNYKPSLHAAEDEVQVKQEAYRAPTPDSKTLAWQERNQWYGTDPEMTASALGLHQKLIQQRGVQYAGTDEYWAEIDKTIKRRFPDYFGESEEVTTSETKPATRQAKPNVVAPATRSTSSKKVVLSQSQVAVAKKLGITPEQYARELVKMGN